MCFLAFRIRNSNVLIRESGSISKYHGSATFHKSYCKKIFQLVQNLHSSYRVRVLGEHASRVHRQHSWLYQGYWRWSGTFCFDQEFLNQDPVFLDSQHFFQQYYYIFDFFTGKWTNCHWFQYYIFTFKFTFTFLLGFSWRIQINVSESEIQYI